MPTGSLGSCWNSIRTRSLPALRQRLARTPPASRCRRRRRARRRRSHSPRTAPRRRSGCVIAPPAAAAASASSRSEPARFQANCRNTSHRLRPLLGFASPSSHLAPPLEQLIQVRDLAHELIEPLVRRRQFPQRPDSSALAPLAQRNSARCARSPRSTTVLVSSSMYDPSLSAVGHSRSAHSRCRESAADQHDRGSDAALFSHREPIDFFFYSREDDEPPHIHVERGDQTRQVLARARRTGIIEAISVA